MRKIIIIIVVILLSPRALSATLTMRQLNKGLRDLDISAIAVSYKNPNLVYISSNRAIYRTEDAGKSWKVALGLRGVSKKVNFLSFDREDPSIIYAASQDGLFRIKDFNSNVWEKVFSGIGELQKNCTVILAEGNLVFLGTKAGLFISRDRGKNWYRVKGSLGNLSIASIDKSSTDVFVAAEGSLFASHDLNAEWKKVFGMRLAQENSDIEDIDFASEESLEDTEISGYVFVDSEDVVYEKIYFSSKSGIFVSLDKGVSFKSVSSVGLTGSSIRNMVADSGDLYLSSKKGVFVLRKERKAWESIYQGLISQDIRFIALDSFGRMWLASDNGVSRSRGTEVSKTASLARLENWELYFKDEPTVGQIRLAAIKYAEVISPKKINNLRKGARLKTLLPDFDLDYGKTINYDSGSDKYYIGPRDWSVGLSWDLGDLVWSDQQRLIDSQTRLMVQLREDILTEVIRLYFERRRLQTDIFVSPPEDLNIKIESELRLQELTARIDGLTGGYLSKQLGLE
ncbi:MAG TPA: hypothetical protein ENH41_01105 [Candidatus Omnitrophica bacterium]|nr:hypothetical protein [Candidatus Omnitrophota bacterium]